MSDRPGISSTLSQCFRALIYLALCLGVGLLTFVVARLWALPEARQWFNPEFWREWFCIGEIMRISHVRYLDADRVGYEDMGRNALGGITYPLDDYSEYLPPANYDEMQQEMEQSFTGIGISFDMLDDFPVVIRTFPKSGAEEAGLLPGDKIAEADGKPTRGESLGNIVAYIKGTSGTRVRLGIERPGDTAGNIRFFDVERRKVFMPTVSEIRIQSGDIGFVRVGEFESCTAEELAEAIDELRQNGAKKLVVDLRDNPGGLLTSAVDTVSLFCKKGTLVTASKGRVRDEFFEYKTTRKPLFAGMPVVILVNKNSASASEIVSGAMQDLKLGVIVGERTFGKGIVQSIFEIGDDRGLKLTTARYILPSGRSIHGAGVQPDIYQPMPNRERVLAGIAEVWRDIGKPDEYRKRFGQPPPADTQLAAACEFLEKLDGKASGK